jgi:hypothetical protein
MKPLVRRIVGVGVLAVLALGFFRGGCRSVPDEPAALREDSRPGPDVEEESRRMEHLDRLQQVIFWAIGQRAALVSDVAVGRLTLFEAAAGFRAVQRIKEKYVSPVSLLFPGKTEEERLCRQVIMHVEQRLLDEPNQATVVGRLERELQEHLEKYGTIELPEPPPLRPPSEP